MEDPRSGREDELNKVSKVIEALKEYNADDGFTTSPCFRLKEFYEL